MRLTIVNVSKRIGTAELSTVMAAIERQVREHFQPEWYVSAELRAVRLELDTRTVALKGDHEAIIYLGDSSQDRTTGVHHFYGYHSTNHASLPYGFVYLNVCEKYKEKWTCTLSHEVLELLADPFAALTVPGPNPRTKKGKAYYGLEVCDPVQGDTYVIDGVEVSNFVTRSYFRMSDGRRHTNFLKLPLKSFGVRPGGYFQYEGSRGTCEINGKKADATEDARLEGRTLMSIGRRAIPAEPSATNNWQWRSVQPQRLVKNGKSGQAVMYCRAAQLHFLTVFSFVRLYSCAAIYAGAAASREYSCDARRAHLC